MLSDNQWKALYRIAFPGLSGVNGFAGNPALWPCSIAYEALGGEFKDGKRITTADQIRKKHLTIECAKMEPRD